MHTTKIAKKKGSNHSDQSLATVVPKTPPKTTPGGKDDLQEIKTMFHMLLCGHGCGLFMFNHTHDACEPSD
jgi:hypothetical protein